MQGPIEKAAVLIEALPYIQRFRRAIVVIKFGGSAMEETRVHDSILADVAFMECVDMQPVLVHGGGKAISRRMAEAGLKPAFVKGRRVTDEQTIRIVERVLCDEVNPVIVRTLERHGARAERVDGRQVYHVHRLTGRDEATGEILDWGFVGTSSEVRPEPVLRCLERGAVPVVVPLGVGTDGRTHNINADEAAAALARALKARKLAYLSDVPGILRDPNNPNSVISSASRAEIRELVRDRVIAGGMLPKIDSALEALQAGVEKVHIIDGRRPHSLLLEIFTEAGVGTEIVK